MLLKNNNQYSIISSSHLKIRNTYSQILVNHLNSGLDNDHDRFGSNVTLSGVIPGNLFTKISTFPISETEDVHNHVS